MRLIIILVAAAALCAAQSYDIVLHGGRVIDPESGLDAVRDVAITLQPSPFAIWIAAVPTPLPAEPTHDTRHQPYGTPVPTSTYVDVTRTFRDGDVLELRLPKTLRLEPTPDMPRRAAILWGPLVLAADLGPEPVRGDATGEDGELTETGPAEKPPPVPVQVVYPHARLLSPNVRAFVDLAVSRLRKRP